MHKRFGTALLVLAGLLAAACLVGATAATPAPPVPTAPQINPQSFASLHWRLIGPFRGGRVLAVSGVAGNPALFYFGSVDGGVWKSDDAGRTWLPIFDGEPVGSIGALAVAPSDPQIIYVGSGEADMRSDISYGNGMYKSNDGGTTWQRLGLTDTRQIARVVVDPKDARRVFIAALGHAYAPNDQRGVFRSTDGGENWSKVLFVDANTGAADLAMDPSNANHLIAAMWQTRRPPWNIYPPSNGPASGLYVTHDGGSSWHRIAGHGLPALGLGRMGIAFSAADPRRVYLIVDAKQGGLYRSDDGGDDWRLVDRDQRIWDRGWYFSSVTADPKNRDVVYVSDTALYRSQNGGVSFSAFKGSPDGDDFHTLWIDPTDTSRMILGCDQGAVVTFNAGRTWSSWYNQPTGQFYHIIADARFPFWLYGSQQDSGAAAVLSRSAYDALTFRDWRPITVAGESGALAPDPENASIVFGGKVERYDLTTSQDQIIDPTLSYPTVQWRQTWTLPIVFSQADRRSLYFGRQVLFRTIDGGQHWSLISPDLSRPNPGVPPNLDPMTAADNQGTGPRRGVIYTIAPSPLRKDEIWAGTDDGKIWLTQDSGAHWRDVTPPALTPWSKVTMLDASWFDPNEVYAAVDRHRLDDQAPYIYRTRDGGSSWQQVAVSIPVGSYVNAIRADPQRRGLLYAGTETGPFVSFDDGDRWLPLQLNLPNVSVRDFAIAGDSLAIATHGRSLWAIDDLAPLRQLSADTASADAWLFAPATTVRVRPGDDQSERIPWDEPAGANPPFGAIFDYELASAPKGPVRIEVLDSSGRLVRQWSSTDRVLSPNPTKFSYMAIYIAHPTLPSANVGLNQFVWDLRYAQLAGLPAATDSPAVGPWAPPGAYSVRLIVDGHSNDRQLHIVRDPRISATDADLHSQFDLALSIEQWRVRAVGAHQRAHAAIAKLKAQKTSPACSASQTAAAIAKLGQIAGEAPSATSDNSMGYPETDLQSLHALGGQLKTLQDEVESADTAPTPDARHAFGVITDLVSRDLSALPHSICGANL